MSKLKEEDLNKLQELYLDYGIQVGLGMIAGSLLSGGYFGAIVGMGVIVSVVYLRENAKNNENSDG